MYVALKYIGNELTPGEVLPEDFPEEAIARLLRAGAIREESAAPAKAAVREETKEPEADTTAETPEEDETDEEPEAPEVDVTAALVTEAKPKTRAQKGAKAK